MASHATAVSTPTSNTARYRRDDLMAAVNTLRSGGIILYPTDTVWGIGCDATNADAVQRIYTLKQRADSKSMLTLLDAPGKLQGYVDVPDMAWQLMELSQRPITIIYPNARNVAANLIADDGTLGIRVTNDPFCRALCEQLRHPIVSTSANISGQKTALRFADITDEIRNGVDYICHYRQRDNSKAQPSSIVQLGIHNEIQIIRP